MTNLISTILIVVAVSFVMRKLYSSSKQTPQLNAGGDKILRYPKVYAIIGYGGITFSLFIALMGFFFNSGPDKGNPMWFLFPLGFSLLGIPMILLRRNTQITLNGEKIEFRNFIGKKKTILWNDITQVKVRSDKQLVLRDSTKKIEVNYSITGFQSLLDMMKAKLSQEVIGDAFVKINKYYEFLAKK